MSAIVRGVKCVAQLFTPSFYSRQLEKIIDTTRADVRAGSIRPFFKAVGIVWVAGYLVNYTMVKRHQVYPRQAALRKVEQEAHH